MKFQRIRIDEAGWGKFNDEMMGVKFTDGLSDEPVPGMIMDRIGAILRITAVDDDEQVGAAKSLKENSEAGVAPVVPEMKKAEPGEAPEKPEAEAGEASPEVKEGFWTLKQLEEIADKHGIAGIREVATPLGLTGRGIAELIREILELQKAN